MRRALREQLPALSHWFGLKGSDLDRMPYGEIETYLRALDQIKARIDKQK